MSKCKMLHFMYTNCNNRLFNKETEPASAFMAKLALAPPPAANQRWRFCHAQTGGPIRARSAFLPPQETLSVIKQYISQPRMMERHDLGLPGERMDRASR